MKKESLSLPEFYMPKINGTTRSESEHLKVLARKIKKVPDTIKIPSEYLEKKIKK